MEYYGARKIMMFNKSLVAVFDFSLDVEAIRSSGTKNTIILGEEGFLVLGENLVIPIEALTRYTEGVELVLAGGGIDDLYADTPEILYLDERAIIRLDVWMEMSSKKE